MATEKEVQTLKREQQQLKLNEATFKSYAKAIMMSEVSNSSRIKKIERLRTVLREMQREEHKYGEEIKATKQKIKDLERENRRVLIFWLRIFGTKLETIFLKSKTCNSLKIPIFARLCL